MLRNRFWKCVKMSSVNSFLSCFQNTDDEILDFFIVWSLEKWLYLTIYSWRLCTTVHFFRATLPLGCFVTSINWTARHFIGGLRDLRSLLKYIHLVFHPYKVYRNSNYGVNVWPSHLQTATGQEGVKTTAVIQDLYYPKNIHSFEGAIYFKLLILRLNLNEQFFHSIFSNKKRRDQSARLKYPYTVENKSKSLYSTYST